MNLARVLKYLVPASDFVLRGETLDGLEWLDPRPMPTLAECDAAWVTIQAQDAAAAQAAQTASANEATIGAQVDAALASNATFLALASPTAAQNAAQVKALTRQMSGLIRLIRRRLDSAG